MYQGTFLSLKPYMKYFDIDILEEKILSAGMANEEQILLPMTYDLFSICIYNTGFTGKYRNIKKLAGISQTKRKSNSTDCRAKKWGSIF